MEIAMPDNESLARLVRAAHYHPAKLAKLLGRSERQLRLRFKRIFGCSPRVWLRQLRVRDVEASLRADGLAKLAASGAGFSHVSSFSRWFKAQEGMTSTEFAVLAAADASKGRPRKNGRPFIGDDRSLAA